MSTREQIRTAIAEAIELAPASIGTPEPGREGATVETIDIPSAASLSAMLAAHKRGERGPVYLLCIPKYAPKGTEGWVYTLEKVNKTTVNLNPVGGGRGLKADPFTLAEADADDLRAYAKIREETGDVDVHTGSVIKVAAPGWKDHADALFVVTGFKAMTDISMVRLGGDGGRTWPSIPRKMITEVIDPAHLVLAMSADPRFAS